MPITQKALERRKRYLGSSDAAAICGVDKYRNAADVFYDKTGQIQASGQDNSNDAIEIGNYCESAVLNWFEEKHGLTLIKNQFRVHDNGVMAANMDALVKSDPTQAVEAKTHAVITRHIDEEWGEVGTNQVPERIALQCQHQMAVVPTLQVVWVPVLMGGVGLREYCVERDSQLIASLINIEIEFWVNHVLTLVPPSDSMPSLETFKRLIRTPNKTTPIADEVIAKWIAAKEAAKAASEAKELAEAELLSALGDAEAGEASLGMVTYYEQERKEYTVKASKFRQLRFKKEKSNGK